MDDKTAWELYYPPWQAAVEAGVSAAMCAYNKEDGEWSCSNSKRLNDDLKGSLGFNGFVQSDWDAAHATTDLDEGLDMSMPGDDGFLSNLSASPRVDDAVTRILAAMYRLNLTESTTCPRGQGCTEFRADVRGDRANLARAAAAEAVILLQNDGVLPLGKASVKTISISGNAADAEVYNPNHGYWWIGDYYAGGGSGHVVPPYVISPREGIEAGALRAGIEVVREGGDVAIVVCGTTSGESSDRTDLNFDGDCDNTVRAQSGAGATVVIGLSPGTVPSSHY